MRKAAFTIIGFVLFMGMATGCAIEKKEDLNDNGITAHEVAESYKRAELEASYADNSEEVTLKQIEIKEKEIQPFVTEPFFAQQSQNRMYVLSLNAAFVKKEDLRLQTFSIDGDQSTNGEVRKLDYTGSLRIGSESLDIVGTMELQIEEGQWRVRYDSYNFKDLMHIVDEYLLHQ